MVGLQQDDVTRSPAATRTPWRLDAREQVAGWGLLVVGLLALAAATAGLLPLALDPDLAGWGAVTAMDTGVREPVATGEALGLGVGAGLGLPVATALVGVGLSVLRSGRESTWRGVLPLVLLPAALVAAAAGLWAAAAAAVAVVLAVRTALGPAPR
ncbi:hypothetical protein [Pseudokineococcus sp. 1T1Z-3]|uniref:hypothetical protein n=1 Tax=Pseudokineococcus sp. 1T1Z-3 TaxID=3132745 RepID=UPI0030ADC6D0